MRSFPIYSEDLNVFKVFTLPNGQRIRFETSFGNLFNRTLFGEPANNWSAANFGQVFSQANSSPLRGNPVLCAPDRSPCPMRGRAARCCPASERFDILSSRTHNCR